MAFNSSAMRKGFGICVLLLFRTYADAAVAHLDGQIGPAAGADLDDHLAGLGEIDGIADQVVEDLAHTVLIAEAVPLHPASGQHLEFEPLLLRLEPVQVFDRLGQIGGAEGQHLEFKPPGLDLGHQVHGVE